MMTMTKMAQIRGIVAGDLVVQEWHLGGPNASRRTGYVVKAFGLFAKVQWHQGGENMVRVSTLRILDK